MERKLAVGLLVAVKEGELDGVIVSRRSPQDSFPRGSQVTTAGKVDLNESQLPGVESLSAGLLREIGEELGPDAARLINRKIATAHTASALTIARRELGPEAAEVVSAMVEATKVSLEVLAVAVKPDKVNVTFGLQTGMQAGEFLPLIQPEAGVTYQVIDRDTPILPLEKRHKAPVTAQDRIGEHEIRMFDDEAASVRTFFARLHAGRIVPRPAAGGSAASL